MHNTGIARRLSISCLLIVALLTASCSHMRIPHTNRAARGVALGALAGAASGSLGVVGAGALIGAFIGYDIQRRLPELFLAEERLTELGIDVIKLGETITLVLSAERFFHPQSPRLWPGARASVQLIDEYIRFFHTVRIDVKVYSDNKGDAKRNIALSRQRAQELIDFMWRDKSDIRLLVARGMGARDPIASNKTAGGRRMNRRVEISFRIYKTEQMFVA